MSAQEKATAAVRAFTTDERADLIAQAVLEACRHDETVAALQLVPDLIAHVHEARGGGATARAAQSEVDGALEIIQTLIGKLEAE